MHILNILKYLTIQHLHDFREMGKIASRIILKGQMRIEYRVLIV